MKYHPVNKPYKYKMIDLNVFGLKYKQKIDKVISDVSIISKFNEDFSFGF